MIRSKQSKQKGPYIVRPFRFTLFGSDNGIFKFVESLLGNQSDVGIGICESKFLNIFFAVLCMDIGSSGSGSSTYLW